MSGGNCAVCRGTGWRIVASADGAEGATRCDCFLAANRDRRMDRTGIPHGLRHCELQSFDQMQSQQKFAHSVARSFVDTYPLSGKTGLLFHGPAGTGKTHLAVAIVAELVTRKSVNAVFLDFRVLLKTIQESWNPVSESSEKDVLERILGADVLALDDLGAEKPSAWVRETVGYLINERYNRAKPVIITTNLRLVEGGDSSSRQGRGLGRDDARLDLLEDRIGTPALSRLYEMCKTIDLSGINDYRRSMKVHGTNTQF